MQNFGINLNLMGFDGAFIKKFQDESGDIFECICIPIKKNRLVNSKKHKNNIYANINALECRNKKYFTHLLMLKDEDNSCIEEKPLSINLGTMKVYTK